MRIKAIIICAGWMLCLSAQQIKIPRIEKMPAMPQPYEMRNWKEVAKGYSHLVFDEEKTGDHLPLSTRKENGVNYADCRPIYMDTYVGWNAHGKGSEAINVIPAVVTAAMFSDDEELKMDLARGVADFFNKKNGENVYLNGFSSKSGKDWWYDVMPNVYFYQLYDLLPQASNHFHDQFVTVADRWLNAVYQLGGNVFPWTVPNMNYRAFDLLTGKPLNSGVREPESAGAIGWILWQAYCKTGEKRFLEGAQLAIEYLNSLTTNPSYELQLPYGVQAAAQMNALLGSNYNIEKMFNWCFDRGALRGWGCIVGKWGGYDVSGLIGEANDRGNDYAFVMNGFQQLAALAPVAKYDKRFARAFAKWTVNNANASRLFYRTGLPAANQGTESYQWSVKYDKDAVIPFESMKENWQGAAPFAMGDALRGGWATTDLSLYSGSSVGYLAAVVQPTEVEGILQLDLNNTDFGNRGSYPTYLYYNPFDEIKTVSLTLPEGSYMLYDAISERFISSAISDIASVEIPSDGVAMVTVIPTGSQISESGNKLYAGGQIIDYHYKYNFSPSLRIKSLNLQNTVMLPGKDATVMAEFDNVKGNPDCEWFINSEPIMKNQSGKIIFTTPASTGSYYLKLICSNEGNSVADSIQFQVVERLFDVPEIDMLRSDQAMPLAMGGTATITAHMKTKGGGDKFEWKVNMGEITRIANDSVVTWKLPEGEEGVAEITCIVSNLMGKATKSLQILVRDSGMEETPPLIYFPFDSSVTDVISGYQMEVRNGLQYGQDAHAGAASSLLLQGEGNFGAIANSEELNFRDAIALSLWIKPSVSNGKEQFLVSHGSWQDRYKLSITPEMTLRWTVKTTGGIADVDYPVKLPLNEFIHATAVYSGFSSELYINGTLVGFAPLNGYIGTTSSSFTVGAMNEEEMNYNFSGCIDELRLYNHALLPGFIKTLPDLFVQGSDIKDEQTNHPYFYVESGRICNNEIQKFEVYSITGIQVANEMLSAGVYIVRYNWESKPFSVKIRI